MKKVIADGRPAELVNVWTKTRTFKKAAVRFDGKPYPKERQFDFVDFDLIHNL